MRKLFIRESYKCFELVEIREDREVVIEKDIPDLNEATLALRYELNSDIQLKKDIKDVESVIDEYLESIKEINEGKYVPGWVTFQEVQFATDFRKKYYLSTRAINKYRETQKDNYTFNMLLTLTCTEVTRNL